MEDAFIFVILLCFVTIVIPMWLKMHYSHKKQSDEPLADSEMQQLSEIKQLAATLSDRVDNLEAILDAETPDWRNKYERA